MSRPLIGLSGRQKRGSQILGMPDVLHHLDLDLYFADYARGVLEAGGIPVHLPMGLNPADVADRLDGVLLSGGADIDPLQFGAAPETDDFPPEPARDEFELALLTEADTNSLPVLGICRGLQMVNVHRGGTLNQDVPPHARFSEMPHTEAHDVRFESDSRLAQLYGPDRTVNSLHHQTVQELGRDLRVTARADDGVVEGIESIDGRIVAVQWHPEMMVSRADDPIFSWIVEAAACR